MSKRIKTSEPELGSSYWDWLPKEIERIILVKAMMLEIPEKAAQMQARIEARVKNDFFSKRKIQKSKWRFSITGVSAEEAESVLRDMFEKMTTTGDFMRHRNWDYKCGEYVFTVAWDSNWIVKSSYKLKFPKAVLTFKHKACIQIYYEWVWMYLREKLGDKIDFEFDLVVK
jgi:hypothetical protein